MAKRKWARALRRAAARGDAEGAARLLRSVPKWRHVELQRALNACASEQVARAFAAHAPAFFEEDGGGAIAVMGAAAHGREATLRALLAAGACHADARGSFEGEMPLHAASEAGHAACAQALLEFGADPHARSSFEWAPLHWAAHGGRAACARVLLRWGADAAALDAVQRSALHWAASCGYLDVLRVLLDAGADVHARDYIGYNPLHLAARGYWENHVSSQLPDKSDWDAPTDHLGCIRALVRHGADVDALDDEEQTPLMVAAENAFSQGIKLLLELGADLSLCTTAGENVLHFACRSADLETMGCVFETGAFDVQCRSGDGSTPLHVSASHWRTAECVEALVRRGADVHARDAKGRTPLHLSASRGRPEGIDALLRLGARVAARDLAGKTPLHRAAVTFEDCVRALLRRGAPVDARDDDGRTPLHDVAALEEYPPVANARALLEAGASRAARDHAGRTPLQAAVCPEMRLLLSKWGVAG
ncbi:hypothetical protein R5R35_004497 [Gryllus longicercus]|uniref:Ankyrin repeat protein n=1 Tax=Gryllus longicercus TaxID=2509291 RepID=A0AAN9W0C5_9ORTH